MKRLLTISTILLASLLLAAAVRGPSVHDDDVRAALTAYLACLSHPAAAPIDPDLIAAGVEAFWSNGETYRGRDEVVRAMEESLRELRAAFESFDAQAENVRIHRHGDVAWITCHLEMSGTLTEGRGAFDRSVRSTFVFERSDGRWRMLHEHSSRLDDER